MSHILHFYHLAALDYVDASALGSPWAPTFTGMDLLPYTTVMPNGKMVVENYVTALNIRRKAHELGAYVAGKHPCQPTLIPGGVTKVVTTDMTGAMNTLITTIRDFISGTYIPDVKTVARAFSGSAPTTGYLLGQQKGEGCKRYLAYGTFPNSAGSLFITGGFLNTTTEPWTSWTTQVLDQVKIREYIKYSHYEEGFFSEYDERHPSRGVTKPKIKSDVSYSWAKAPRYCTDVTSTTEVPSPGDVKVCEVGPLARVLVNCFSPTTSSTFFPIVNDFLTSIDLDSGNIPNLRSVLGRHAARAIECEIVASKIADWIGELETTSDTGQTYRHRNIPREGTGVGLTEAPRGALGHWIRIDGKKVSSYQCVVPTTWNVSPKDTYGQHGPIEQALSGTTINPAFSGLELLRIIHSFDPCIACTVHVVSPDKKNVVKFEVTTSAPLLHCDIPK
jgi:hydrogenase large subunit